MNTLGRIYQICLATRGKKSAENHPGHNPKSAVTWEGGKAGSQLWGVRQRESTDDRRGLP